METYPMIQKIPLSLAMANLAEVLDSIDSGELDATMAKVFHETSLDNVSGAIDRRICFMDYAEADIEKLKGIAKQYIAAAKYLENAIDNLEQRTIAIMEAAPNFEYKGSLGRFTHSLSQGALEFMVPTKDVSVSNSILESDVHKFKIPQKYMTQRLMYQLDNAAIKEDLKKGEEFAWCRLKHKKSLKISRK
jgi:hypothetical protein